MSDWNTFGWRIFAAEILGWLISAKAGLLALGIAALETNPYPAWRIGLLAFLIFLGVWNGILIIFGWALHPKSGGW